MADERETPEAEPQEQARPKGGKGALKLLLAVALLIASGGMLAMMAVPVQPRVYKLQGPFFGQLFSEPITVTTPDNGSTRYLKFRFDAEFAAYEESYFTRRQTDPFYLSYLTSVAERVASSRLIDQSATGPERDLFAAEVRRALEPVVFPVHIGETKNPLDADGPTGLRPGVSHNDATFRGRFHDHVLKLDGPAHTLQLDGGPEIVFRGDEDDLEVHSGIGDVLYVDVTHFDEQFQGQIKVGVHGKLRQVILHDALGQ